MIELPRIPLARVLDDAAGRKLIGNVVPEMPATLRDAGLYVDSRTDAPVLLYAPFPGSFGELRRALLATPMSTTLRGQTGLRNVSRTFGFRPKSVVLKFESCRPASLAMEAPWAHAVIVAEARRLDEWLRSELPDVVAAGHATDVGDDWRLAAGTYWTSGVVNLTSALPYHRDRNNFPIWSAMAVARRNVIGGHLSVPEYDAAIACRDGWVVCFNGHGITHGVTPMRLTKRDGYRLSCVYYCLRGLRNCADDAREQARARERRTERERTIAAGGVPGGYMRSKYQPSVGRGEASSDDG